MSARILGNTSLDHFDVLIIGSGTGASAVAAMLTTHGQNVLILEAGTNRFDGLDDPSPDRVVSRFSNDELKLKRRHFVVPDPVAEPRTFRPNDATVERTIVGDVSALPKTVGGSAVHSDIKTPRFQPQDFRLGTSLAGSVTGATFADWPVDYDMLEPFYVWAERALGVQGLADSNPFDGPRSAPFPMPPGAGMYGALRVIEAAARLGYHPYPFPTAINSRPYDGRPPCVDCGFCSDYGCPSNAKGSPAVTTLRRALLSGRCQLHPETRVVRLIRSATGRDVTGVEVIGPDGARAMFRADRYVIAASPIEDARLLLMSDPGGAGVGNSSGLVGRNLMFHLQSVALGIFDDRVHGYRGRTVTHALSDFRGVPGDPRRPLGGIVEVGSGINPIEEALHYAGDFGQVGLRLNALMRQSPARDRVMALSLKGEDAPQARNRVDLDPAVRDLDGLPVARVSYSYHPFELTARDFYAPTLMDILQAAGARYVAMAPLETIPQTAHVMGTLRFGADPAQSVCDATGRFHDVGNLYAADGSLWPTSSGFNPILTLTALGARIGAGMVFPGAPERGLT